jgi:uncharacterized damage-inducible protein DinB
MNIERLRHLYEYHFTLNRKLWERCIETLTEEQFMEDIGIAHGSLRNIFVHIMSVDERWFSGFRNGEDPGPLNPASFSKPNMIREKWDLVEEQMREVLLGLSDAELENVYQGNMKAWHVLSHVVNHGTHHRAQIGEILKHYGQDLSAQDYIFYVLGRI